MFIYMKLSDFKLENSFVNKTIFFQYKCWDKIFQKLNFKISWIWIDILISFFGITLLKYSTKNFVEIICFIQANNFKEIKYFTRNGSPKKEDNVLIFKSCQNKAEYKYQSKKFDWYT